MLKSLKESYRRGVDQALKFEEQRANVIGLRGDVQASQRENQRLAEDATARGFPDHAATFQKLADELAAQVKSLTDLLNFINNERDRWHADQRWAMGTTISLVSLLISVSAFGLALLAFVTRK